MPASTTLGNLPDRLRIKVGRLASPELARDLANQLSGHIIDAYFASGMSKQTGNTIDVLSHVGEPEKTSYGVRIGVIGPKSRTGDSSQGSPKGTIGAFLKWYNEQEGLPKFHIKGGVPSQYAWWLLSRVQKEELQKQRETGQFGGETAAAVGRVPYIWSHEQGNPSAGIQGRQFIQDGLMKWRASISAIVNTHRKG